MTKRAFTIWETTNDMTKRANRANGTTKAPTIWETMLSTNGLNMNLSLGKVDDDNDKEKNEGLLGGERCMDFLDMRKKMEGLLENRR